MAFTLNRKCKTTKQVRQSGSQGDNDDDKYDKEYFLLLIKRLFILFFISYKCPR